MKNHDSYCVWCKRQFKSHLSLYMHYVTSKYHRKDTPLYHQAVSDLAKRKSDAKLGIVDAKKFRTLIFYLPQIILTKSA